MSGACLDENEVAELLSGAVTPARREAAERHLDRCDGCRTLVADLAALSETTIGVDPGGNREPTFGVAIAQGKRIDHFVVDEFIGRGGMGDVYAATDAKLGRKVALKFVRPALLESDEAIARFQREARATARFSHPNIVAIHFVGEHRGRPYVALEFLEGQTLRQRLAENRPGRAGAIRILTSVAEALAEAHRHGVLHRDLKPDNVHIDVGGRVRVLDFGLAKFVASDEALPDVDSAPADDGNVFETRATGMAGTPNYMAPEQWRGQAGGEATDVWAFGVIAFQLLAGRLPYESDTVRGLSRAVLSGESAPRLDEVEKDVPTAVATAIERCLDKDPSDRPSVDEVIEALRAGVARPSDRRLGPSMIVGLAVIAVAGLAAVAYFVRDAPSPSPAPAQTPPTATIPESPQSVAEVEPPLPEVDATETISPSPAPETSVAEPAPPRPAPSTAGKRSRKGRSTRKTPRNKDSLFGTRE